MLKASPSSVIDHCFFSTYSNERQRVCAPFSTLASLARVMEPADFSQQLGMLVSQCPGRELVVTDGTSCPDGFDVILHALQPQLIRLVARTDVNEAVGKTLGIDLLIAEGLVSFRPHWTAYKEIRASELLRDLRWLWQKPYRQRVVVASEFSSYQHPAQSQPEDFIREVFGMLNCRAYSSDEIQGLMVDSRWDMGSADNGVI